MLHADTDSRVRCTTKGWGRLSWRRIKKKSEKKKEKHSKKKKKGKRCSSWLHQFRTHVLISSESTWHFCPIRGSSGSSSSSNETDTEPSQDGFEDAAATFGLAKKETLRTPDATTLVDLEARPTALVLSKVCPHIIANDIYEMGGELAACLD